MSEGRTKRKRFGRGITFRDDTVIKHARSDLIRIEAEKTRRAYEIGEASGLFVVPKVLDCDLEKGDLILERFRHIHPLATVVASRQAPMMFAEKVGRVLAVIHNELVLPSQMVFPLPDCLALPGGTEVFIHGDFTTVNVCVRSGDDQLVVLDWRMVDRFGGIATRGTRHFDLAFFVLTMFIRRVNLSWSASDPAPPATAFLRSYFDGVGDADNHDELGRYMTHFLKVLSDSWKTDRRWLYRVLLLPSQWRFRAFAERLQL